MSSRVPSDLLILDLLERIKSATGEKFNIYEDKGKTGSWILVKKNQSDTIVASYPIVKAPGSIKKAKIDKNRICAVCRYFGVDPTLMSLNPKAIEKKVTK